MDGKNEAKGWKLYWVESDGIEDCFVIARNHRGAIKVECDMNGFNADNVTAERIMALPELVIQSYLNLGKFLPGYLTEKRMFFDIGAQFRDINDNTEMLLNEIVFEVDDFNHFKKLRYVGHKSIKELNAQLGADFSLSYESEDIWAAQEEKLLTLIGKLIWRCQLIEQYLSHSFIFAVSHKKKGKYKTIANLIEAWKKKTFGQIYNIIGESYVIEPTVQQALEMYLDMRNQLIHGIAKNPKYDIRTQWGRAELVAFLYLFDVVSISIKKAFRASWYASIELIKILDPNTPFKSDLVLSPKEYEEIELFIHYFKLR